MKLAAAKSEEKNPSDPDALYYQRTCALCQKQIVRVAYHQGAGEFDPQQADGKWIKHSTTCTGRPVDPILSSDLQFVLDAKLKFFKNKVYDKSPARRPAFTATQASFRKTSARLLCSRVGGIFVSSNCYRFSMTAQTL